MVEVVVEVVVVVGGPDGGLSGRMGMVVSG